MGWKTNIGEQIQEGEGIYTSEVNTVEPIPLQKTQIKSKFKFGTQSVSKYFKRLEVFNFDEEIAALEKSRRLEMKELPWKRKKDEYVLRRVAKDWIMEMIIPTVVRVGQENIEQKCYEIVDSLIDETWSLVSPGG